MEYGLVLVWFVAYAALAAVTLPAAAALFSRFPGKGAGFALPLGLATLAMSSYYVGRIAFGYESLLVGLLVIAAASGLALRRGVEVDRHAYLEVMAVFGVAFLLFVGFRALDPAAHPGGGEKFLDFGLLNSLMRGPVVPPEDMWFAGEPVAYYYGGHMMAALMAKLTFTPARYAYNLALPGFYGLLVTGAYTLAGAVAKDHGADRVSAGVLAALLVAAASNLVTPLRFLAWVSSLLVPSIAQSGELFGIPLTGLATGPENFGYWAASRVIDGTINEFPFFAFVNGDMHAHMMSTGFLLLVAGLLYAYWQTPAEKLWHRRTIAFGCLPVMAGLLAITNTWSFPTVAGLTWIGILFAPARPWNLFPFADRIFGTGSGSTDDGSEDADPATDDPDPDSESDENPDAEDDSQEIDLPIDVREEVGRMVAAVAVAGIVGVVGFLLVYPFFTTSASDRSLKLVEQHSGFFELLVVHGGFLAITLPYLAIHADPGDWRDRARLGAMVALIVAITVAIPVLPVAVPLFVPALLLAWILLRTSGDVSYETALVVGVLGLVTLVEFVYVTRAGRYNTVFKFYMQVWVLWGTAAGVILARHANPIAALATVLDSVVETGRSLLADSETAADGSGHRPRPSSRRIVGGLLALVLVASMLLYPTLAMAEHVETSSGPATLDATSFLEERHQTQAGSIHWMRENVSGQPNMVSIPTRCLYRWSDDNRVRQFAQQGPTDPQRTPCNQYQVVGGNPVSSLTGIPTVAGWYHEVGYRGHEPFIRRVRDVETIYNGSPEKRVALLEQYDVEYVYFGPAERYRWGNITFEDTTGLEVVYEDEWVTIYRVHQDRLGVASGARVEARSNGD